MNRHFLNRVTTLMAMLGLAVMSLLLLFLLLGRSTVGAAPGKNVTITSARSLSASFTLFQKSVDELFAVPGERRTYQIVFSSDQDVATARLTDTLPSAVTWAGDISATRGSASHPLLAKYHLLVTTEQRSTREQLDVRCAA